MSVIEQRDHSRIRAERNTARGEEGKPSGVHALTIKVERPAEPRPELWPLPQLAIPKEPSAAIFPDRDINWWQRRLIIGNKLEADDRYARWC